MHHQCMDGHTLLFLYQIRLLQPFTYPCWTQKCNTIQSRSCTSWSSPITVHTKYVCPTDHHHSFVLAITPYGWQSTPLECNCTNPHLVGAFHNKLSEHGVRPDSSMGPNTECYMTPTCIATFTLACRSHNHPPTLQPTSPKNLI